MRVCVAALLLVACGQGTNPDAGDSRDAAGETPCDGPPGLYEPPGCVRLAPHVIPYAPRFALWSDDSEKERFVAIPAGAVIDGSNVDDWRFPVGTRFYKTFSVDGRRLETRVFEKIHDENGPSAWRIRVYAWSAAQSSVTDVTNAETEARENVLETEHDIPSAAECIECHSGGRDLVNGFSALQLNDASLPLTLVDLLDSGVLLGDRVTTLDARVTGDDTTVAALGYLHANCGHCHRRPESSRPGAPAECRTNACFSGLYTWLYAGEGSPQDSDTFATSVAVVGLDVDGFTCRVQPGRPLESTLYLRMLNRGTPAQMPPLGTERTDGTGTMAIEAWIRGLGGAGCPSP